MDIALGIGIVLVLVFGAASARKEYSKLTAEEKEKFKGELRNPLGLLFAILMPMGSLLVFISIPFQSVILKMIAFGLIGTGLIIEGAELSKHTSKGMLMVVIGASTVLITGFFATKSFW
ncbi:hypothetical protein D3H55_00870 [Bacillus salacetis]|uniref:Uncharacterized protein n=1 Tax=Bacillus salacetis TaxID=2315464 RepID=A0A3A1RBA0_9BACI|nr:hypothetical protein [Bacillus salacetis]RIW38936.1 hypothetical protein D3H55_00870 [Bacillus salacetis]